jgi:hypothetical protein
VASYKLYYLGRGGHIEKRGDLVEPRDDAQAVRLALKHADGRAMELWDGPRLVKKFPAPEPKR